MNGTINKKNIKPKPIKKVEDPKLAEHLARWGINIMALQKTEKTLAEMQFELNKTHDFNAITEAGADLVPVHGPGLTGLTNLGEHWWLFLSEHPVCILICFFLIGVCVGKLLFANKRRTQMRIHQHAVHLHYSPPSLIFLSNVYFPPLSHFRPLGNSCYMNSTLQLLLLPPGGPLACRFGGERGGQLLASAPPSDPASDVLAQLSKVRRSSQR
jgi:hypothetical protein